MIEVCAGQFDYVLIDTPPLESVADALRIATHADGVVLVVRSGRTSRKLVADAAEKLRRTGAPILGVVLSRAEHGPERQPLLQTLLLQWVLQQRVRP